MPGEDKDEHELISFPKGRYTDTMRAEERGIKMDFQTYLDTRGISKYRLSKLSGVPKTTVMDICSGKSSLQKCSAGTIRQLAKALQCTMEDIMAFDQKEPTYDKETGLPTNREYLERGLPPYLQNSIRQMCASWAIEDSGQKDYHWDIVWSELNADINAAESGQEISSEQAWYLREKYLRMKRGE